MRTIILTVVTIVLSASSLSAGNNKSGVTKFRFINNTSLPDLPVIVRLDGQPIAPLPLEPGEVFNTGPIVPGAHAIVAEVGGNIKANVVCEAIEGECTLVTIRNNRDVDPVLDPDALLIECPPPGSGGGGGGGLGGGGGGGGFGSLQIRRELAIAFLACSGLCLVYGSAMVIGRGN